MHAVEGGRLRRAYVCADVLDRVVAQSDELAVGAEPASTCVTRPLDDELAARCSRRSSIQRTGTPSFRDASPMRTTYAKTADLIPKEPPESGGVIRRNLEPGRPSAPAATEWSVNGPWKFAQAVSEPSAALQSRRRRSTRPACSSSAGSGSARARRGRLRRARRRRRRTRTIDPTRTRRSRRRPRRRARARAARTRPRSARVRPRRGSGRGRRRRRRARRRTASSRARPRSAGSGESMPAGNGRESSATSAPVRTPTTPGSSSAARRVEPRDARVRIRRAQHGSVPRVRDGVEIVDEATLAAQQRVVLEAGERAADPRLARRPWLPRAYLTIALWPGSATIFAKCSRAFAPGR